MIRYSYKELHAEQIKTLYLLGCKTIDDLESINVDNETFMYGGKLYNIHNYLMEYKKEFSRNIATIERAKSTNTKIDMFEFNNMLNRILYYIGTASIYLKFCDTTAFGELSIQDIYDYYGCDLELLIRVLLEQSIGFHTKEIVEAMAVVRKRIILYFGNDLKVIDFS